MLDEGDLEGSAEAIYELAGYDRDDVDATTNVARKLGIRIVRVAHMTVLGSLSSFEDRPIIAIRAGMSREREGHVVGHELGHWILRREGHTETNDEVERACDFIGAAVMMPRRVFASCARGHERDFRQLAFDFAASQTMAALRVGEVLGVPIIVVAPHAVRARGQVHGVDEQSARGFAARGGPGISRIRLTDDRRRVALVADDATEVG